MARPRKSGLDYLPLDVNLDYKWEAIELMHGGDGCWACLTIVRECYKTDSGEIDFSTILRRKTIEKRTNKKFDDLKAIIDTAVDVDLFDKNAWETSQIVTSDGIKKRIDAVSRDRKNARVRSESSYSPNNNRTTDGTSVVNRRKAPKVKERKGKNKNPYSPHGDDKKIESIYQAYPRKIGKTSAMRAIKKSLLKIDYDSLLAAVEEYSRSVAGSDRKFIPHPATWFNAGRWEDDRSEWQANGYSESEIDDSLNKFMEGRNGKNHPGEFGSPDQAYGDAVQGGDISRDFYA